MSTHRTRWEPEVCRCLVAYTWTDAAPLTVTDVSVERVCAAHALLLPLPLPTLRAQRPSALASDSVFRVVYDALLAEQRTQDLALAAIAAAVPALARYQQEGGGLAAPYAVLVSAVYAGVAPGPRRLILDFRDLHVWTPEERAAATAAAAAVAASLAYHAGRPAIAIELR